MKTSSDDSFPPKSPEPLVKWILKRVARSPVSGPEILREILPVESRTKERELNQWRLVLGRLVNQGFMESGVASSEDDSESKLRMTQKGLKYLEDLTQHASSARPRLVPQGVSLPPHGPVAHFNRPIGPKLRELGVSTEMLEAKVRGLPAAEREQVLKDYAASLEVQLDWTNRLIREARAAPSNHRKLG